MQTELHEAAAHTSRVARARQPAAAPPRSFLSAAWRWLAMLNYQIAAEDLLPLVPRGTQLDLFQGRALITVVGFWFADARLFGWRVPLHQGFPEVNLRCYVRRDADHERRRGVVFIKEIVPRRMVAWTARLFYGERFARTTVRCRLEGADGSPAAPPRLAQYVWGAGSAAARLAVAADTQQPPIAPTGEAAFVVNRWWAYTARRDGAVHEYEVRHRAWRMWPARQWQLSGDLPAWYGRRLASALSGPPTSAFLVDGSDVAVLPGREV